MTPLQIIEDHYAASARGDLDGMVAPFAPDVEWTEMAGFPYAGTYHGPAAVREAVFERLGVDWAGYEAVPEQLVDDGESVVAFGTYSGTYRATGKAMRARFVHHWTVRDGRVVRFEQFTDTHLVRAAMS
ncbi:nuclear transport factor 2 family protein [Streptomyces sp. NPDC005799]|uniref:nuclear transport factor 2 family protein n=1 Tax=Streptomyces sp. NPDC005799 TaxID=3154678 RepID=UPI00340C61FA